MEQKKPNIPLIVLLGPTASGKSSYAIELAREYGGEIVSADSRQVYRGLDIGSGKVTREEQSLVPHHLLDVANPGTRFTVADFKRMAEDEIHDIWQRGMVPFLVGGSSLYLDVVVENYQIPSADIDTNYRHMLERRSIDELLSELEKVDPILTQSIDKRNKRRIIRALEVYHLTGVPLSEIKKKGDSRYHSLIIGVLIDRKELYNRIDQRVEERMHQGMLNEVEKLLEEGVSDVWLRNLGLEYRILTEFLCDTDRSDQALNDAILRLKFAIHDFARRQLIWLRKNTNIRWCADIHAMRKEINQFLATF